MDSAAGAQQATSNFRSAVTRPGLRTAVRQDARRTSALRGEAHEFDSRLHEWSNALRLVWASDDFLGVVLYRLRTSLRDRSIPVLPWLLHGFCRAAFRINIGDDVTIGEGLYVLHGNVTIQGLTHIGSNVTIAPWASIRPDALREQGPVLGDAIFVGTGSTIHGAIAVGDRAIIGARSVVHGDVPPDVTVVGEKTPPRVHDAPNPVERPSPSPTDVRGVKDTQKRNENQKPPFGPAVRADSIAFSAGASGGPLQGEWRDVISALLHSRFFAAVCLYRLRSLFRSSAVPVLPALINKATVAAFNVRIGDSVLIAPGIRIPNGNTVIDGITSIDSGCTIGPSTTIGLQPGAFLGPRIESDVTIGANAAILGDIRVGRAAQVSSGAVVVRDVQDRAIVAARPVRTVSNDEDASRK